MAKFSRIPKLTKEEQEKLIIGFCRALVALKTPEEAVHFLKDLLSEQEAQMLAKRIAIARLLIQGLRYGQIRSRLKVSQGTIARVSSWLATSGEGYRLVIERVKDEEPEKSEKLELIEELNKPVSWKLFKRRYPMYFWPELLVEEIIKSAKKRQRERLRNILSKFKKKSDLFEELNMLLKDEYKRKRKPFSKETSLAQNSNSSNY